MSNQSNLHFVVSAPRSGSTWLTTALNHHPDIFATEHRLFGQFCEVWKNNDGSSAPRITFDCYARAFAMHYFYQFMDLDFEGFVTEFQTAFADFMVGFAEKRTGKKIVVDKITPYPGTATMVVEQINKLFPNSSIIQLVRDGRDVLTSGTFDWLLKDGVGTDRFEFFVNKKKNMQLVRFFDDEVIEKWASNWKETIDAFADSKNHTLVTYEAMKSDLSAELSNVFAALKATSTPELIKDCVSHVGFEKMTGRAVGDAEPTAKARKGVVGDWKNYFTRQDGELFNQLAGQQLVQMGYEPNNDWVRGLPETLELKA